MCPSKTYVEVLIPSERDSANRIFARGNQVKMRLLDWGEPLIQYWCPYKKKDIWGYRETQGRRSCDDRGRNWSYVATGQEMPRIASHKLRETIKESSLQGQHGSANTLILDW